MNKYFLEYLIFFVSIMTTFLSVSASEVSRIDTQVLEAEYRINLPINHRPGLKWVSDSVTISTQARFSLYTLMGEPIVFCSSTWQLKHIDGLGWLSDIPAEVLKKVELYNLHFELQLPLVFAAVECDSGVPYANGSSQPSFNIPGSPEWDRLFYNTAVALTTEAFRKGDIPWSYSKAQAKSLLKQAIDDFGNGKFNPLYRLRVLDAQIDLSSIRNYLLEVKLVELESQIQHQNSDPTKQEQVVPNSNNSQNENTGLFTNVVESAFIEKEITLTKNALMSLTKGADTGRTYNQERYRILKANCANFEMPESQLVNLSLTNENLQSCVLSDLMSYKDENTKRYGYKNAKGEIKIPAQFVSAREFSDGVAVVSYDPGIGIHLNQIVIDPKGNVVYQLKDPTHDLSLGSYHNGLAIVRNSHSHTSNLYDKKGNAVFNSFIYGRLVWADSEFETLLLKDSYFKQYFNIKGEELYGKRYVAASEFTDDGIAVVASEGFHYYLINKQGETILASRDRHSLCLINGQIYDSNYDHEVGIKELDIGEKKISIIQTDARNDHSDNRSCHTE